MSIKFEFNSVIVEKRVEEYTCLKALVCFYVPECLSGSDYQSHCRLGMEFELADDEGNYVLTAIASISHEGVQGIYSPALNFIQANMDALIDAAKEAEERFIAKGGEVLFLP